MEALGISVRFSFYLLLKTEVKILTFKLAQIIEQHCEKISGVRKAAAMVEGEDTLSPWLIIGVLSA